MSMTVSTRRTMPGAGAGPQRHDTDRRGVSACLAMLVLALATGTPLHSVHDFLPHPGEQATPYLGV